MELIEKGKDFLKQLPKEYYLPLAGGCVGLLLLVWGLGSVILSKQPGEKIQLTDFSQDSSRLGNTLASTSAYIVDVEGAVAHPGIAHVSATARVSDAITSAGGFSPTADTDWVEKHLNLAAKVSDGVKLYIPEKGEGGAASGSSIGGISSVQVLGSENSQIDINSASSDSLDGLPGIGPVTVEKIVSGRPYASVQDLLTRKIVTQSVFAKIKDLVVAQ